MPDIENILRGWEQAIRRVVFTLMLLIILQVVVFDFRIR